MKENERITSVLVDACAFRDVNSDFLGIIRKLRCKRENRKAYDYSCRVLHCKQRA